MKRAPIGGLLFLVEVHRMWLAKRGKSDLPFHGTRLMALSALRASNRGGTSDVAHEARQIRPSFSRHGHPENRFQP